MPRPTRWCRVWWRRTTTSREIYRDLLQDERIDVRNRVTYIESCRGGDGLILLGQLHDPFDRRSAPGTSAVRSAWRRRDAGAARSGPGGCPRAIRRHRRLMDRVRRRVIRERAAGRQVSAPTCGATSSATSSDWLGWLTQGSSCSRYNTGDSTSGVFPTSVIEAMVFYQLADRAGHPVAKIYIEALKGKPGDNGSGSDQKPQSPDVLAKSKAQRWLAPFEFYAAETRYRGETPSGLVHSDECAINATRAQALALGERLIPQQCPARDAAVPRLLPRHRRQRNDAGDFEVSRFPGRSADRHVDAGAADAAGPDRRRARLCEGAARSWASCMSKASAS